MGMLSGQFALLFIFGFLLIKATDQLVNELRDISQITHIGKFGLTAFLIAFATSLPELVVGIVSALEGRPTLSLGNVLGSNIADIALVMGGAAIVGGSIRVLGEFLRRDFFSTFLAGSMPLLLLVNGELSRIDAVVLLAVYVWYTYTVLAGKTGKLAQYQKTEHPFLQRLFLRLNQDKAKRHYARLIFWTAVLLLSADMLVRSSVFLAGALGIPIILIGLFFVAVGTSLPEFAFELRAVRSGETAMVFGNLLGSVVANSTLILGLTALISPIHLDGGFQPYLLATVAFVVTFAMFWIFVSTKRTLERWEGVLLLLVYLLFAYFEFSRIDGHDIFAVLRQLTEPF